jgi:transposase
MRPHGSSDQLEIRRKHAVALLEKGETYRAVARNAGASLSSVVRWFQAFKREGEKGLNSRPTPGRPCRLSERQKQDLEKLLLLGAKAAGYSTDLWTLRRIGALIKKEFKVNYTSSAIWRLLVLDLNWSTQKPERRATQRDEAAIVRWKKTEWPRIKKKRVGWVPISHL